MECDAGTEIESCPAEEQDDRFAEKTGEELQATLQLEPSASDLQLQLLDQREQFLFDYEQLEDEILELRNVIGSMQSSIDEANRRWKQERDLKLQLERQVIESIHIGAICAAAPENTSTPSQLAEKAEDSAFEDVQPGTPPGHEDFEVGRRNACHSVSESAESPASFRSLRASAESDANLALALEAQVELASLREEHRHLITELVQAKLEVANLRAGQEFRREIRQPSRTDSGHLCSQEVPQREKVAGSKAAHSRRWFTLAKDND